MQNYSGIQQFLHDFVLRKKFINKSLFELEKIFYLRNIEVKKQSHIFISGLPRSGTTSLLNFIYSSNEYVSLTYKNMPFVLSPNFSKIFNKKNILKKERMHRDGINYDMNSPEAFDEIFFNNDKKFIEDELINFIKLILIAGNKNKYLSKNNLNYKRIKLIFSLLPNSVFLIPIREPLQHSYSLLNQHLHFSKLQKKNDFIRRYMNYLGHKEFGIDHISWNKPINFEDTRNINYWLEQWKFFYQNILNQYQSNENCHFVIYDELSNATYIKNLLNEINFYEDKNIDLNYFKIPNKRKINLKYSQRVYEDASNIYKNFKLNCC
tara:strand:- start:270 stop:1235 length:966 start_codon:yes stop_codon:yes gene_type:complete